MAEEYKKATPEELSKAWEYFNKVKERRAKAKEKRKALTPEEKAKRGLKSVLRRARSKWIALEAEKAGIRPTDAQVLDFAKKLYPEKFKA